MVPKKPRFGAKAILLPALIAVCLAARSFSIASFAVGCKVHRDIQEFKLLQYDNLFFYLVPNHPIIIFVISVLASFFLIPVMLW